MAYGHRAIDSKSGPLIQAQPSQKGSEVWVPVLKVACNGIIMGSVSWLKVRPRT